MTAVVIDSNTNEVIACIPEQGQGFVKDGYEIITTNADNEPIFKNDNGVIKLNLSQWNIGE